jgi:hypothetical protein
MPRKRVSDAKTDHIYAVGDRVFRRFKGGPDGPGVVEKAWVDGYGFAAYQVRFGRDPWGPIYEDELSKAE